MKCHVCGAECDGDIRMQFRRWDGTQPTPRDWRICVDCDLYFQRCITDRQQEVIELREIERQCQERMKPLDEIQDGLRKWVAPELRAAE